MRGGGGRGRRAGGCWELGEMSENKEIIVRLA